jgi:hypothetical protein
MRKNHKEENSGWGISSKNISVRESIPKGNSVRGRSLGWKDTFSIDEKRGEIYQMQGSDGHMGSMSDMNLVFHHIFFINSKGGYC